MEWLNYHHLLYFWMVAKEGSIARAGRQLRLAHPTISAQIHRLESVLGQKLFVRRGRTLALTEEGHLAFRYADEIFSLGQEFLQATKGRAGGRAIQIVVGVSDALSKVIVQRILEPAFRLDEQVRVVCREDRSVDAFLGELAARDIDVVLSDAPAGPGTPVRAFNHFLGECGTAFFAAPLLARRLRRGFPGSLDGAPLVLPGSGAALRGALEQWLDAQQISPKIVAEIDDSALAAVLAERGLGLFAAPDVIGENILRRHGVQLVGRASEIRQRFYAISVERKIKHPAVAVICEAARRDIFASRGG